MTSKEFNECNIWLVEFEDLPVAFPTEQMAFDYACNVITNYDDEEWNDVYLDENLNYPTKQDVLDGLTKCHNADHGVCYGFTGVCTLKYKFY